MKIALIQQKFHSTKEKTIEKTCEFIEQAAKQGAELICLGELHQSEYFVKVKMWNFLIWQMIMKKMCSFGRA